MKKEETKQILQILKLNYPNSFTNLSKQDSHDFLEMWHEAFKDDDVKIVALAVKSIIYTDTREFYPNIAQVKKEMYKLLNHDKLNEFDAWAIVLKALEESRWESVEEFNKLPDEIKEVVISPKQLEEWAWLEVDTLNGVVASNFYKAYRANQSERFKVYALPNSIKNIMRIENKDSKIKGLLE